MYRLIIFILFIFGVVPFLFWLYLKIKNSAWLESIINETTNEPDFSKSTDNTIKNIEKSKEELNKKAEQNKKTIENTKKDSNKIDEFLKKNKK